MKYKYKEREYAQVIFNKGFQTRFIRYELVVLVKYLKELNYTRKGTEKFLYDFCKEYIPDFNVIRYYKIIDGAIRDGRKKNNKLISLEYIPILNKELKYINNLNIGYEYKKLLLAFLVKRKIAYEINKLYGNKNVELSPYFNGTKRTFNEIFKMANINKKGYKINDMVFHLVKNKIIESIIKGDIVLSFIYSIYDTVDEKIEKENKITHLKKIIIKKHIQYNFNEDDIFIKIKDFTNIGYVFDYYKGNKKIRQCEQCGKLIEKKSNRTKYCDACAKKIKNQQNKQYYKELGK